MDLSAMLAQLANLSEEERLRLLRAVFATLSVEERIQLVQAFWDSIAAEQALPDLTESQKRELDRRMADLNAHPENVLTWEEIKARVRGQR